MTAGKYSLVAGLLNQNSPVRKISGPLSSRSPSQGVKAVHSTSYKKERHHKNELNVGNDIIDHIVTEKKSPQANSSPLLENIASAVTKLW